MSTIYVSSETKKLIRISGELQIKLGARVDFYEMIRN